MPRHSGAIVLGTATIGGIILYAGLAGKNVTDVFAGSASLRSADPKGGKTLFDIAADALSGKTVNLGNTAPGTAHFEGHVVAKCAVPILECARSQSKNWHVTSGYRTPEYSDSLCQKRCGAPSCPGTCAGRSSNHGGKTCKKFALDIDNPDEFEKAIDSSPCSHLTPHIHNDLPSDRVHFSPSGN